MEEETEAGRSSKHLNKITVYTVSAEAKTQTRSVSAGSSPSPLCHLALEVGECSFRKEYEMHGEVGQERKLGRSLGRT